MYDAILKFQSIDNATPVIPIYRKKIVRWIAAASVLLLAVGYWLLTAPNAGKPGNPGNEMAAATDVSAPTNVKATITLTDGRTVNIDGLNILQQENVTVTKVSDGRLVYESTPDNRQTTIAFNTLTNPRGSKIIDMIFSDGSHVWLNAGSSITYPVAFTGNERKVTMTGEAYFEIAKDATKKFIVDVNGVLTEVLGTHFNVNAYDDEDAMKITLLEGSVRVTREAGESVVIKPGQQVIAKNNSPFKIEIALNPDKVIAWKNNEFIFSDDDLESIMRQLARWYDIIPIFPGKFTTNYTGQISRSVPISQVLSMFEKIGYVKFEINGRDVKVIKVK